MTDDEQYLAILNDLFGKLFRFDHHGVWDAAVEARVFESAHPEVVGRFLISGQLRVTEVPTDPLARQ